MNIHETYERALISLKKCEFVKTFLQHSQSMLREYIAVYVAHLYEIEHFSRGCFPAYTNTTTNTHAYT